MLGRIVFRSTSPHMRPFMRRERTARSGRSRSIPGDSRCFRAQIPALGPKPRGGARHRRGRAGRLPHSEEDWGPRRPQTGPDPTKANIAPRRCALGGTSTDRMSSTSRGPTARSSARRKTASAGECERDRERQPSLIDGTSLRASGCGAPGHPIAARAVARGVRTPPRATEAIRARAAIGWTPMRGGASSPGSARASRRASRGS